MKKVKIETYYIVAFNEYEFQNMYIVKYKRLCDVKKWLNRVKEQIKNGENVPFTTENIHIEKITIVEEMERIE